ncbi:MAG: hypothetical protein HC897_03305 [Thermoanaerobaculia bacterium]|nr:hypothetical protein [Thermoanaerobaculia bacterium]
MKQSLSWWMGCALIAVALLTTAPTAIAKEGFGFTKKSTKLTRVTPPTVFLMGTRIAVVVSSTESDSGLCQRLQSQLESELVGRDNRLTADSASPQTLVEVTVLQNQMSERWENRTELESREVGKDAKGKAVYKSFEVSVRYKVVTHSFGVAFKVTDKAKNASLDADTIQIPYEKAFREGNNAPASFTIENDAITAVVDRIARRITPTREQIGVLLPKGRLGDLAGLADAGQWSRYLDAVEAMPASPNREDEAYRQYALGTAYEALGYAADDPETTLKYLEQAARYYDEAIGSKPDEKFFSKGYDSFWGNKTAVAPLERARSALVSYRRIKDFQDNYDAMIAAATAPSESAKAIPEAIDDGKMNNTAVIRMVKAGLGEDIILTAIETAPEPQFDVTPRV